MKKVFHLSVLFMCIFLFTTCEEEMPEPNEWRILEWTLDGERHKVSCVALGFLGVRT